MRDVQLGQVYRHFKGDYYLVEALARDSEFLMCSTSARLQFSGI